MTPLQSALAQQHTRVLADHSFLGFHSGMADHQEQRENMSTRKRLTVTVNEMKDCSALSRFAAEYTHFQAYAMTSLFKST